MAKNQAQWSTAVGEVGFGKINVRGYRLQDIIEHLTFAEAVFLVVRGQLPTPAQARTMDAALKAILEHGFYAPTTVATRVVASATPESIIPALAGGLLTVGSVTVSPQHTGEIIEQGMALRNEQGIGLREAAREMAERVRRSGKRMPGLGHPLHPEGDPRAIALKKVAQANGVWGEKAELFEWVREEYTALIGRPLPINVDGMLGAVLSELGFTPKEMPGIAALSFLPGMIAHAVEETSGGITLRIVEGEYTGPEERDLPEEFIRM